MKASVKEDHYCDASFREKYFRPTDYQINSAANDCEIISGNKDLSSCESQHLENAPIVCQAIETKSNTLQHKMPNQGKTIKPSDAGC